MNIRTVSMNPLLDKEVTRNLTRLLAKRGFDTPYGALNAGQLAFELHKHQLPKVECQGEIATVFNTSGAQVSKQLAAAWSVVTAMMYGSGQPFGMIEEGEDAEVKPFMEVRPRPDAPTNSNASTAEFRFHTDNAALPKELRPKRISLACLINEARAATGLVAVEALSENLPLVLRYATRERSFVCATPPSFGTEAYAESEPRPLLFDTPDGVEAAFSTYRTRPVDPADEVAIEVLREIERLANELATWIVLEPGQILHFDNARSMHARKPINGARLLLRAYWRNGLRELDRHAETDMAYIYSAKRALMTTRAAQ